ncbi:hypothetical protein [Hamadaea tsunoensis]|uniref:hypothetical protein n=1 Tax=Hamadaea tsunoensis TaxID=53368 RepID=UPI00048A2D7A|nr:hypothetical protein [Hamadaea tsunoensis]
MTPQQFVAIVLMVAVLGGMAVIILRCLADLARTPDGRLRLFTRTGWKMMIVFAFPVGIPLYLLAGKAPY